MLQCPIIDIAMMKENQLMVLAATPMWHNLVGERNSCLNTEVLAT